MCGFKWLIINELQSNLEKISFLQNDTFKSSANYAKHNANEQIKLHKYLIFNFLR